MDPAEIRERIAYLRGSIEDTITELGRRADPRHVVASTPAATFVRRYPWLPFAIVAGVVALMLRGIRLPVRRDG